MTEKQQEELYLVFEKYLSDPEYCPPEYYKKIKKLRSKGKKE